MASSLHSSHFEQECSRDSLLVHSAHIERRSQIQRVEAREAQLAMHLRAEILRSDQFEAVGSTHHRSYRGDGVEGSFQLLTTILCIALR